MIRSVLCILSFLLSLNIQVFSQENSSKPDSIQILSLTQKGEALLYKNELDSAISILNSANNIIDRANIKDVALVHGVKNRLGIALAYKQLNRQSISIFKELKEFYRKKNSQQAYDIQIAQLYNNIAINYNLLFDYEQSLRYFDSSLVFFQKKNVQFENQVRNLYLNKAMNHLDLSNYQSSIENLELAKLIRLNNPESDPSGYEKMKENLTFSDVLIEFNQSPRDILEAKEYLEENIALLGRLNSKDQYLGHAYHILHKAFILLNEYDSALHYAEKSVSFTKIQYGANHTGLITHMAELGKVYVKMGEDAKALQALDSAISIPTPEEVNKNVYKADAHLWKAKVYSKNNEVPLLINELIQATKLTFPTFSQADNIFANPVLDSLFHHPYFSIFFIKKGTLLKEMYNKNDDVAYLKSSLEAFILGIKIGMSTRKGLVSLRAKSLFASTLANNFDEAISSAHELS